MIQSKQVEDGWSEICGSLFSDESLIDKNESISQKNHEKSNIQQKLAVSSNVDNLKTEIEVKDDITEEHLRQIIDDISHAYALIPFEILCGLMNHV